MALVSAACSSPADVIVGILSSVDARRRRSGNWIALVLACLLASIVLLGASSGPPLVSISDIQLAEDGAIVRLVGVLVDLMMFDSGTESLILADLQSHKEVKVIVAPGIRSLPSDYAHVGDELEVVGEVDSSETSIVVYAVSDGFSLIRESARVLTVRTVSENWPLFEGDVIRVRGVLRTTDQGAGWRLHDCTDRCSMAISSSAMDLVGLAGATVTLTAKLLFDHRLNVLTLVPVHIVVG